jgi:hypothetical protein
VDLDSLTMTNNTHRLDGLNSQKYSIYGRVYKHCTMALTFENVDLLGNSAAIEAGKLVSTTVCVCLYVCVCLCVCVCVCVCVCGCAYTCIYRCECVCECVCIYSYVCVYMYICIVTHIYTHTHL